MLSNFVAQAYPQKRRRLGAWANYVFFEFCADLMSATAPVRVGLVGREKENVRGSQIKNYSFLTKDGNLEYSNFHVDQLLFNTIFKNIFWFNFWVCLPARPLLCNRWGLETGDQLYD
jgi:hypothetical protein